MISNEKHWLGLDGASLGSGVVRDVFGGLCWQRAHASAAAVSAVEAEDLLNTGEAPS
jgi:hypothetical protein